MTTGTAVSATDSSSDGFVTDNLYLNNSTWDLWKCTGTDTWELQGNIEGATGATGQQGLPGENGQDGTDGTNGTNSYIWVRYSESADGTGFDATPTPAKKYMGVYAGTSSTAPTNKTAYAWVKYIGEDGNGAGDMLKSEFATNGTTGVVDTSNRLRKYVTTSSRTTYVNQWTKVAELTFTAGYQNENVIFSVINRNAPYGMGIFSLFVRVGGTFSTHSHAILQCISADKNFKPRVGTIKIVYTAPKYELWYNPTGEYSELYISILNESNYGVGFTWLEKQPYQATQPAGTVVTATLMEDYLITDLTAETAIADADYFMMHDTSAVANRKTLWSSIKSTLKAYFDTLYDKTASTTVKGGIKIGNGLTISNEVLSANVKGLINNKTDFDAQTVSTSQAVDSLLVKTLLDDMSGIALTGTLAIGATSITFTDAMIVTGNTIKCDYYTDVYGISPTEVTISTGSMTLTFSAQTVAVGVRVEIREV